MSELLDTLTDRLQDLMAMRSSTSKFEFKESMEDATESRKMKELIYSFWRIKQIRDILDLLESDMSTCTVNMEDNEHAAYFLKNCHKVLADDYVLTNDDMLRLRRQTFGTSSLEFLFNKNGKKENLVYVKSKRTTRAPSSS